MHKQYLLSCFVYRNILSLQTNNREFKKKTLLYVRVAAKLHGYVLDPKQLIAIMINS